MTPFDFRYQSEAPGLQKTTATFSSGGVETFDNQPVGAGGSFTSSFGPGSGITGTFSNVQINTADQYGGASGSRNDAVAFERNGA